MPKPNKTTDLITYLSFFHKLLLHLLHFFNDFFMSASRNAGVIRRSEQSLILRSSFLRPGNAVKVSAYSNTFIQLFSSPVFYIMVKKLPLLSLFLYQNMDTRQTGPGLDDDRDRVGNILCYI